jgi:hypothetical protein
MKEGRWRHEGRRRTNRRWRKERRLSAKVIEELPFLMPFFLPSCLLAYMPFFLPSLIPL